jgi:hypothetical protein
LQGKICSYKQNTRDVPNCAQYYQQRFSHNGAENRIPQPVHTQATKKKRKKPKILVVVFLLSALLTITFQIVKFILKFLRLFAIVYFVILLFVIMAKSKDRAHKRECNCLM